VREASLTVVAMPLHFLGHTQCSGPWQVDVAMHCFLNSHVYSVQAIEISDSQAKQTGRQTDIRLRLTSVTTPHHRKGLCCMVRAVQLLP
jgi:hypothetical protein